MQYDLAVAGGGLGGLAAAVLLSAKGRKVMVCNPLPTLSEALGATTADGFRFSSGPKLLHGLEPEGPLRQFLRELDICVDCVPPPAARYQVVLPDRRITISSDPDETMEDLRREFPREIDTIARFHRDLKNKKARIPQSRITAFLSKHRSADSVLRSYSFSREFLLFLDVQSLYFYRRPCSRISLAMLMPFCTGLPTALPGGYQAVSERIDEAIRRKGGALLLDEPHAEIVIHRNEATGVKTSQGVVEAKMILLCDSDKSMPSLFLGVHAEVVPVGMSDDVLYLPDYERPYDFLACSLSDRDDAASAPPGMRALAVTFHSPSGTVHDANTSTQRVSELIPFLKDFLVLVREGRSATFARSPGLSFKPMQPKACEPVVFKTSKRNLYLLHEEQHAPFVMVPAMLDLIRGLV